MSLEQQISKGIMEAMKAKDTVRLSALRNAKKYIIEAKTAGPEIAELPDADVLKIISKLAKQGTDSAAIFTEQNRPDLAAEELAQVAVFQEFLPKQLTAEELAAEVKAVIAEVGATSMKEMGKVMGVASKRLAGRADGKDISAKVKELLAAASIQPPVTVEMRDGTAELTLNLVVKFGAKIPAVAEKVQENVKSAVQNMTNVTVSRVNLVIAGLAAEEQE